MCDKQQLAGAVFVGFILIFLPFSGVAQFMDCWFDVEHPADAALGQRLAEADRIELYAEAFINFDYSRCYRMGRSCSSEFPLPKDRAVESAHVECISLYQLLSGLDRATWQARRVDYHSCMVGSLRREAEAIRASVYASDTEVPPLSEVLAADRAPRTLSVDEVVAVTTDVTWCPTGNANFQAAILCRGGGMVAATFDGESRMGYQVSATGELCLKRLYPPNETCHRLDVSDGILILEPPHPVISGPIRADAGVQSGNWLGCSRS